VTPDGAEELKAIERPNPPGNKKRRRRQRHSVGEDHTGQRRASPSAARGKNQEKGEGIEDRGRTEEKEREGPQQKRVRVEARQVTIINTRARGESARVKILHCVSWNVGGIMTEEHIGVFVLWLQEHSPDLVAVQETHAWKRWNLESG
jgi:hypothetical protein